MKPLLPPVFVNGIEISAERIAAEAQNHPAPKEKPGLAWKAAARALAIRELMLQEARARGLTPDPAEVAPGQVETEDEALIRQLSEAAITPAAADEAELRRIYDAHPGRFRAPSLYEAAHILLPRQDDMAALRAHADTVLAELRANPRRFGELARTHSACSSKENGGLLGQLGQGDTVPEFEAALETLEEGRISDPVETRFGLHLIRLDARARGDVLPFESVLPRLRDAHAKAAWARAAAQFTAELVAAARIDGVALQAA
ncbi:peptidylprolyl isomerase [Rhodobacteraceae bacterium 2376]|uniref:Parvulin-like PPIase n=1 Tax=Rhabdonatronobacter sediminivivens TaxID=2743469 RepID=A0A7Z0I068_9RHOB|nr:peptidylprolyl isomerase [Rhabdonatronobacter sediminivivens]NYS25513.1 peptidylprolyl isomerase [Rhabdonatronobacter sediminivivens]